MADITLTCAAGAHTPDPSINPIPGAVAARESVRDSGFQNVHDESLATAAESIKETANTGILSATDEHENKLETGAQERRLVREGWETPDGANHLTTTKGAHTPPKQPTGTKLVTKRPPTRCRLAKVADQHISEKTLKSLYGSYLFAQHINLPLNTFLTINVVNHDQAYAAAGFRDRLLESLTYAWGNPEGGIAAIFGWENPKSGGNGNHVHMLAHVPPDNYKVTINRIISVLSKQFSNELDRQYKAHRRAMEGSGMPRLRPRATSAQKYDALLAHRSELIKDGLKQGGQPLKLPFYFGIGASNHALRPEKPLDALGCHRIFCYMCKGADPTISHTYEGQSLTLQQMSTDTGMPGWAGNADTCTLQEQSRRRFPRRTCAASRKLGPKAKADPANGFTDVDEPVAEWFVPRLYNAKRWAKTRENMAAIVFSHTPPSGSCAQNLIYDASPGNDSELDEALAAILRSYPKPDEKAIIHIEGQG